MGKERITAKRREMKKWKKRPAKAVFRLGFFSGEKETRKKRERICCVLKWKSDTSDKYLNNRQQLAATEKHTFASLLSLVPHLATMVSSSWPVHIGLSITT